MTSRSDSSGSDRFSGGLKFFNEGRFFDAHEAWEDAWRASDGEEREWLQGLVQVAAGLHHLGTGNVRGGRNVLARGLHRIEAHGSAAFIIDNTRLINDLNRTLDEGSRSPVTIHPTGGTWGQTL